jgi:F-box protein 9
LLNNEMLLLIFAKLPIATVSACQVVCKQWRTVGETPSLWRAACKDAFRLSPQETNERLLFNFYRSNWKIMFLDRPHLRFEGIYVARNTYIRTGATEWKVRNPVHLVAYYRYCRFFSDGTFLYRTTPEVVGKVVKSLMQKPSSGSGASSTSRKHHSGDTGLHYGRYKIDNDKLYTAVRYHNSTSTEVRSRMKIRSTVRGAHNRLDIQSIVSYDREDGSIVPMMIGYPEEEEEEGGDGVEQRRYSRGLAPYVFIPFEACQSHVLNLPVDQMDVWIPG